MNTKWRMLCIISIFLSSVLIIPVSTVKSLDNPYPVYGNVYTSDGGDVPNGVTVYIEDITNGNGISTVTYTSGGHTGHYQADLSKIPDCQDGDIIICTAAYNGKWGNNTFVLDVTNNISQCCDIYLNYSENMPPVSNFAHYQGIDVANNDYVNISLRVAGEKHRFVNLTVCADNNSVAFLSVERLSGKPQVNATLLLINSAKNYIIVIDYTADKKGGNPVWINITYRNFSYSTHLVFHETSSKVLEPSLSTTLDFMIRAVGLVKFDASTSYDPDGTITQYSWDFGDGETGAGEVVYHRYAYGNYTISLTVKDEYNFTDTESQNKTVNDVTGLYAGLTKSEIVTLFCPADVLITNKYNTTQWIGQENNKLVNWMPNATGIVYGDVEIYIIPQENIYSYDLSGVGPGEYDFSIFDPGEYDPGEYDPGEYDPGEYGGKTYSFSSSVSATTVDSFTLSATGNVFTVTSNEDKYYSMYIVNGIQTFVVSDMSIGNGSLQSYTVTDWDKLGSTIEAGVSLCVDDDNDGIIDFTKQLTSGSKGTDIIRTKTAMISGNNVTVKYTGPAALNIKPSTGTVPDNLIGIGVFVEVTGASKNILITIQYTPEQLKNAGVKASDLHMYYWNETQGNWILIPESGVWENNNTVWTKVDHLTIFAPMAEKTAEKEAGPISSLSYIIIFAVAIILISAGLGVKRMKKGKTTVVRCPKCKKTFQVPSAERPLNIVCPTCGAGGTIGKLRIEQKISPEKQVAEILTRTIKCPKCMETFKVEVKEKPFKIKCPRCGTEGIIK